MWGRGQSHLSPLLIPSPPLPPRCPSSTARSGLPRAVSSYSYQGVQLVGDTESGSQASSRLGAEMRTQLLWAWTWTTGHRLPRSKSGWGRSTALTQGTGPLGAEAALAPLARTPLPGRSRGLLEGSQGGGNTRGPLHPVRGGRQVRGKVGGNDIANTHKELLWARHHSKGFM